MGSEACNKYIRTVATEYYIYYIHNIYNVNIIIMNIIIIYEESVTTPPHLGLDVLGKQKGATQ